MPQLKQAELAHTTTTYPQMLMALGCPCRARVWGSAGSRGEPPGMGASGCTKDRAFNAFFSAEAQPRGAAAEGGHSGGAPIDGLRSH